MPKIKLTKEQLDKLLVLADNLENIEAKNEEEDVEIEVIEEVVEKEVVVEEPVINNEAEDKIAELEKELKEAKDIIKKYADKFNKKEQKERPEIKTRPGWGK